MNIPAISFGLIFVAASFFVWFDADPATYCLCFSDNVCTLSWFHEKIVTTEHKQVLFNFARSNSDSLTFARGCGDFIDFVPGTTEILYEKDFRGVSS